MPEPSPYVGVFRWAWHQAKEFRTRFWVGAVSFSGFVSGITIYIALPPTATTMQQILAAAAGLVGAAAFTTAYTYGWALMTAPYQQRNALRAKVTELGITVAELQVAPVPVAHAEKLRQVTARLQQETQRLEPLDYGPDAPTWRRSVVEHFPAIAPILASVEEFAAKALYGEFRTRMDKEAQAAGMTTAPWLYSRFAAQLADTIERRAVGLWLHLEFQFDWQRPPGDGLAEGAPGQRRSDSWWVGDPYVGGIEVFANSPDADVPRLQQLFEQFMKEAESWPEALRMAAGPIARGVLYEKAEPLLAAAANTDPITTRCFLCRGAGDNGTDLATASD